MREHTVHGRALHAKWVVSLLSSKKVTAAAAACAACASPLLVIVSRLHVRGVGIRHVVFFRVPVDVEVEVVLRMWARVNSNHLNEPGTCLNSERCFDLLSAQILFSQHYAHMDL